MFYTRDIECYTRKLANEWCIKWPAVFFFLWHLRNIFDFPSNFLPSLSASYLLETSAEKEK